ncbi:L-histidine Nalpha-methyltransferase [Actinoplanes derwentensis]|uniref:L-histidine Nalpha-methyltransferase n=1 Tax=Actinoplanes derwentensis TaxID=113562 RepID=A0A1H2A8J8_9ACTN|nr:L-histidine Nalpha-methyltransferase [Actinoplanes derwentensis]
MADALIQRREFPQELTFLGDGAELWRAVTEDTGSTRFSRPRASDLLLEEHVPQLLGLLPPGPVPVLDLGPGTGRPAEGLLTGLLAAGRFGGYHAIDISPELLAMTAARLSRAFPAEAGRMTFTHGDFRETVPAGGARLVLLTGGTLFNAADPGLLLRHLAAHLGPGDLLVITARFDTLGRAPFRAIEAAPPLPPSHRLGLDLLNIDPDWYDPERGFDPARHEVWSGARLNRPVTLHLDGAHGRRAVDLHTGDLLRLYWQLFLDRTAVDALLHGAGLRTSLFQIGRVSDVAMIVSSSDITGTQGTNMTKR